MPALEIEKKRFVEKEQHYMQQIEQAKKELESIREREKDLKDKLNESENRAVPRGSIRESFQKGTLNS